MERPIEKNKCDTCVYAWTDECPLKKCWEHDYKYYENDYKNYEKQTQEKIGMKRLTYDAKGRHFCDYSTREIINRLAECEIMLERIEQIVANNDNDGIIGRLVKEILGDGNNNR